MPRKRSSIKSRDSKKGLKTKEVTYDGILKAARTIDGFDNFVSRLGLNNDNTLSAGIYTFNYITRNRIMLEAAYRGSWIVGRVIDSIPEDMTRAGIDITTDSENEDIDEIQSAISKLRIWWSLGLLGKWGRLYGGAIGVIQIKGQDMATPLRLETVGKDQFQGITVYDRWQLNPQVFDVIDSGPEIGLPAYYDIVTNPVAYDVKAKSATGTQKVHHSRIIRYTGIDLPFFQAITEMMWGESVLERLWDRLISFDNATMSCASLIDRANLRTVRINGLREIISGGGPAYQGLLAQFEMMRQMQVNEGLTLLDKEDEFASTAYSFAGLSEMMLQFGQQLAGASETPLVRLFGQSPAGMNSTGDGEIRTYYDMVKAQQEVKYRPGIEILLKVLWRSTFGKDAPPDMQFEFVPLWQMTETDKAANAKTMTDTVLEALEKQAIDRSTAMKELRDKSGDTGLFSNITDEQIKEAEEEPPPLPEMDVPGEEGKTDLPDESGKPPKKKTADSKLIRTPTQVINQWLKEQKDAL